MMPGAIQEWPGRCDQWLGSNQCQATKGHLGIHWANTSGHNGVRWGIADYGCLVGIEQGLLCMERGPHTRHRGRIQTTGGRTRGWVTWDDPEPEHDWSVEEADISNTW